MRPKTSLRVSLADPELLGHALSGDSWRAWRIMLMAIMGEALEPDELATFRALTGRNTAPAVPVREAAVIVGRRGGKTRALSVLASYIATLCDHPALVPGETGSVLLIAMDRDQAGIAMNYAAAAIEGSPLLAPMIRSKAEDTLSLTNGVEIAVRSPSFRRLRGRTAIAVLGDESAFWFEEGRSANPDTEIIAACKPMLMTTKGPLLLASSAHRKAGVLYEFWRRDYGADGDPGVLVARGTSQQFNPTLGDDEIARAVERDPEWARAEYLSEWRSDLESYIARETVESCVELDVRERPFQMGCVYHAFVDAAGGSGSDSMALAIGHKHGDRVLIDAVREVRPPFSPADVTADFVRLLKGYRVNSVRGDHFAGQWVAEAFRMHGVTFRPSEENKSALYGEFLPLLNTGTVVLLDDDRMVGQIAALERRTRFGGRGESVDHPPKAHDDLANVVAGAAVHAQRARGGGYGYEDRPPPRVVRSYEHVKNFPRHHQPTTVGRIDKVTAAMLKHEIEVATTQVGPERHRVPGANGCSIALHGEPAGDGRRKYAVYQPDGTFAVAVWGKDSAERAARQFGATGTITRER